MFPTLNYTKKVKNKENGFFRRVSMAFVNRRRRFGLIPATIIQPLFGLSHAMHTSIAIFIVGASRRRVSQSNGAAAVLCAHCGHNE
jgi:hypothetical protein